MIVIVHTDTDFYFEYCNVGINLLNFFTVTEMIDIPKWVFLFYTNHFGLQKEIDLICKNKKDQPMVIESFIDNLHYNPDNYENIDLNLNLIEHNSLCMMHIIRSHRNAMFHIIKDIPDEKMIKAFTVQNND
jgi:hypothetical protein